MAEYWVLQNCKRGSEFSLYEAKNIEMRDVYFYIYTSEIREFLTKYYEDLEIQSLTRSELLLFHNSCFLQALQR